MLGIACIITSYITKLGAVATEYRAKKLKKDDYTTDMIRTIRLRAEKKKISWLQNNGYLN